MRKIGIVVHGGAGSDSDYIRSNIKGYKKGLEDAIKAGYSLLEEGASAVDAVEAAVNALEDNPLFNAGKGSAINSKAEVEMCASIMNGKDLNSGAVAIVKNIKNTITLARAVMEKTKHIYLGNKGAMSFAEEINIAMEPDAYFITEHQFEVYEKARKEEKGNQQALGREQVNERMHGTVGAVALDWQGNLASATSTRGIEYSKDGRIGDSSMIGVGSYANNRTCAISSTGDGELIIQHTVAFHISAIMEYRGLSLEEACTFFINEKCKDVKGDIGIIGIDGNGNVSFEFKSERMHRGYRTSDKDMWVGIYPGGE